jgi:selenide,water dikinase
VSDPYDFGRIAACNALSDVYAMGGKPLLALSILGWPTEKIALSEAKLVLKGAEDVCKAAGIHIAGGHSIETSEPLFGLSVNGIVAKKNIKKNNTAGPGDFLYLSKPLGLGLLSNALKHKVLSTEGYNTLIDLACRLNTEGILLGQMDTVTAVTDVTGFGLLGHLTEMLGEDKGAILERSKLPVLDEARKIASGFIYPNISTSNYNFIKDRVDGMEGLEFLWLCDPQTSGGLLFTSSVEVQVANSVCIGRITDTGRILIQP